MYAVRANQEWALVPPDVLVRSLSPRGTLSEGNTLLWNQQGDLHEGDGFKCQSPSMINTIPDKLTDQCSG